MYNVVLFYGRKKISYSWYSRYWTGTNMQWRLMRGNIIKKRLISCTFEKIPHISLSCKLVPVLYREYEYGPLQKLGFQVLHRRISSTWNLKPFLWHVRFKTFSLGSNLETLFFLSSFPYIAFHAWILFIYHSKGLVEFKMHNSRNWMRSTSHGNYLLNWIAVNDDAFFRVRLLNYAGQTLPPELELCSPMPQRTKWSFNLKGFSINYCPKHWDSQESLWVR